MLKMFCIVLLSLLIYQPSQAEEVVQKIVVAKVNQKEITLPDLNSEINRLVPQTYFHSGISDEKRIALQEQALNNLIEKELKIEDAEAMGLKIEKRYIKKELNRILSLYPNRKAFQDRLKAGHFTIDDVKNEIRRKELAKRVYRKRVTEQVHVTDEAAQKYYEKNKSKFVQPVQIHLKNILFRVPPLADDFERKTIEQKASKVLEKIRAGELSFEEAVQKYSEDPNKERGGDMGALHKGRLAPEVEEKVFSLKPGELAGPFKTFKGYFLFRFEELLPERQMTFEEIRENLIKELQTKWTKDRENEWMEKLKTRAEIVRFPIPQPPVAAPAEAAKPE